MRRTSNRWNVAPTLLALCVLAGITHPRESHAQVRPVRPPVTPPVSAPTPTPTLTTPQRVSARIFGTALDSTTMRPLVGALIQLVSPDNPANLRSATTDASGTYTIDSVGAGTYLLGFLHPRLDSLQMAAPMTRVDVRTDGEIRAPITIPSTRTILTRLCGPQALQDSLGVFMGIVRPTRGTTVSAPARVRAQWIEVSLGPKGIERHSPSHFTTSSPTGEFALCGIPIEGTFLVRAFVGTDSSGFIELEGSRTHLVYRDIYVGEATKALDRASLNTLRGNGAIKGTIRSSKGPPIRDARVVLWGSGREDTTNVSGQFTMSSLPAGTYSLEARALGFLPKRIPVDIPDGTVGAADVALDVFVPTLDTMRVRANRTNPLNDLSDFDRRKKMGGGYYIDETQLNRRGAMFMADVLRGIPGVTITPHEIIGDKIMMRGTAGAGSCTPAIFINGARALNQDGSLDGIVNPQQIRAIEVYSHLGSTPSEFSSQNGCGSIVIWTGMRNSP